MIDGYQFKKGDVVKWVGPPKTIGGGVVVVRPNELREVIDVRPGVLMLNGTNGLGSFGWVDSRLVEKVDNLVAI